MNNISHVSVCFNSNRIVNSEPIFIADTVCLRSAREFECALIDDKLELLTKGGLFANDIALLGTWHPKDDGSGGTYIRSDRPRPYVVLDTKSFKEQRVHESLLLIAEPPLLFGFGLQLSGDKLCSVKIHSEALFQLGNPVVDRLNEQLVLLTKLDENSFRSIWNATASWSVTDWTRPLGMIDQYAQALRLSPGSRFQFLALCTVIEGMLVHRPKSSDSTESTSRQIKRKIPLLFRRCPSPALPSNFFPKFKDDQSWDALWGALYDLRSEIAHGDQPTFTGSGKGKIDLVDLESCVKYVSATCRMLIRQLILEPQLMRDLQDV